MPPVLQLRDVRLTLGGQPLLDGAELSVAPRERIALVGRNGSGKSTLLKIAAGDIEPDDGSRFAQPGAHMRYLQQEPDLSAFATVSDFILNGLSEEDDPYRARALMEELGVQPDAKPSSLSGGEARRAALVRTLAPMPEVLLLDEPTNHLDLLAIEWLEKELSETRSAFVLISHDKRLLANLTRATVWLDRGATRRLEQGFAAFEAWRDQQLEEEEIERHKLDRRIVMEEHWLRYGVTARRKRNMRRVGELGEMRKERREARRVQGEIKMAVSEASASGKLVIEADRLAKSYGERPIVRDFSIRVARGDRLGIIGANGAGKTTLVNLITGVLAPDSGAIRLGASLEMATLDQRRASLEPTTTLVDALTGGGSDFVAVNGQRKHVFGYMKDFLFGPEQARTPIGKLSGGERGRLMLARALAQPSNLLVLDEPTNDLDIETLDLLQELLADYPGTIVLVSHDRDFLDRVATSVIVSEGDGRWMEYAGGYSDMIVQRGYGLAGPDALAPPKAAKEQGREAPRPAAKRRLSFKEKHALEKLPQKIADLRGVLARLDSQLADPQLHARDPKAFSRATNDYGAKQKDLTRAEEEWLTLEMLREEIEG
ncbi:ABC-F family ATP-binding cassette domain-containing protein [Methylocapsa sp. S129]|uniref:ABC-F family ATP-binding cassette domain-containing protein n=1 Tax=Methylocapsa sp. S129 TaxID=1641869 RepID=UPI00131BBB85|nr:ATP-binding cassette domain-containing protein [Methylocapsa sp. S129]